MLNGESIRTLIAFLAVACLASISVAAASRSGVIEAEQALASPTTLVPRPDTDSSTSSSSSTSMVDFGQLPVATDGTPLTAPTTAVVVDPYAWLETIPVAGRTFVGVATDDGTPSEVADFGAAAGINPDVVMVSRGWSNATPDLATIERITADGHLPMIAWEPWNFDIESTFDRRRGEQPEFALSTIVDGSHDELIEGWAAELAAWGRPVALRFAHEMNGFWYPWAESTNGNRPGQYVAAWRYVHDKFDEAGADNVIWVWSPNSTDPSLTPLAGLYPGDDYVDWVGLVGYLGNGIDPSVFVPTFDQLFGPTIDEIRAFTDLPLVITEIGATEDGGQKAPWISHMLGEIGRRDDIIGFIWFEINKETDWRIVSSDEAAEAFATAIDNGSFGIPRG